MIGGLAALFFLFNTGQLTREKTKLVNTADAVAYSAGVMHARALNYDAYLNRASVANEVIIAQMVSLSSWAQYLKKDSEMYRTYFPYCGRNYYVAAAVALIIGALPEAKCAVFDWAGSYYEDYADELSSGFEKVVMGVEVNKSLIKGARNVLHSPLFQVSRKQVMQEVADANYVNDGSVTVSLAAQIPNTITDKWGSLTQRYTGDERKRMGEVTTKAANSDDFVKSRYWNEGPPIPSPTAGWYCTLLWKLNEVRRRGGTELINLDEWKAEDTESLHWWETDTGFFSVSCDEHELPLGWAEQKDFKNSEQDASGASLGGSPATNPDAHASINSSSWSQYTGIPEYYDLKEELMKVDAANPNKLPNPTLQHAILLFRDTDQTLTSEGRSQVRPSPRLNNYTAQNVGGKMSAMSTSEVFFMRPPGHKYNRSEGGDKREIASLFNPYWQVRLVETSSGDIGKALGLQKLGLP